MFDYQHPEYLSSGGSTHSGQLWKLFDTVIVVHDGDADPHLSTYRHGLAVGQFKSQIDAIIDDLRPRPKS